MDQELKSMLETIINSQEALNIRFDGVDSRFDGVDSRLDSVDSRLDSVDIKLDAISNQLDRIEADTNDEVIAILESINGKMEVLATKEDIDYLAEKLGKHDLEIDRLKRVK